MLLTVPRDNVLYETPLCRSRQQFLRWCCKQEWRRKLQPWRWADVRTDCCFGLTFLFHKGRAVAIHRHTSGEPCASSAAMRLLQRPLVWVYLPLASHDRVIGLGTRYKFLMKWIAHRNPTWIVSCSFSGRGEA